MTTAEQLESEGLISTALAARLAGVQTDTVSAWTRRGSHGVVLEHLSQGGRVYTSRAALERFRERSARARKGLVSPPVLVAPEPGSGTRAIEQALASVGKRRQASG